MRMYIIYIEYLGCLTGIQTKEIIKHSTCVECEVKGDTWFIPWTTIRYIKRKETTHEAW